MRFLFFALLTVLISSCANLDPNDNPNSEYGGTDRYGNLTADTLYALQDTVRQFDYVSSGTSLKLSLADLGGLKAGFFIRFTTLPDSLERLLSAQVDFITNESFGLNIGDSMQVDVFSVSREWISTDVNTTEDFRNNPPADYIETISFSAADSARSSYVLPMNLAEQWILNDSLNYGLYFTPRAGQGDVAINVGALGASLAPQLIIERSTDSTAVRDTLATGPDATLFSMNMNPPALQISGEQVVVASGVPVRTFLKFDLSSLPRNAIYYDAYVTLFDVEDNPYENPEKNNLFYLRNISEAGPDLSTFTIDSSFTTNFRQSFSLEQTSSNNFAKLRGFERNYFAEDFIQLYLNGEIDHEWFLLHYINEGTDLSVKRFYGAGVADKNLRPILVVKYINGN